MSCGTCGCAPCLCGGCDQPAPVVNVFTGSPEEAGGEQSDALTNYFFWEELQEVFIMPAIGDQADIRVEDSDRYAQSMYIFIPGAGFLEIVSRPTATSIRVENVGRSGNAPGGTNIAAGTALLHGLPLEAEGDGGPQNLADELADDFTVPAGSANMKIQTTVWCYVGMELYLFQAGFFTITAIVDDTTITVSNTGDASNAANGTVIPTGNFVHPVRRTGSGTMPALSVKARAANTIGVPGDLAASAADQYLRVNAAGTALEWGTLPDNVVNALRGPGGANQRIVLVEITVNILNTFFTSAGVAANFGFAFANTNYFIVGQIVAKTGGFAGDFTHCIYIDPTATTGATVFLKRSYNTGAESYTIRVLAIGAV
jgi:hypothetical protein